MLTTSANNFTGTAKDDTFLATSAADWSVGDSLDGGKGTDTLKIIDTAAIDISDVPVGGSLKNVEILDLISGDNVDADTTLIDGLTLLNITSKTTTAAADNSATASATTDIRVTDTNADTTNAANTITVNGGKDVTVVSKNNGTTDTTAQDNIIVGNTTAAAGTVTTVINDGYVDAAAAAVITTLGNTVITGGTKINASSKVEFTAAQITAASTILAAAQDTVAQGSVTVNGNASTTEVTVSQTAAQAKIGTGVDGQIGITAGAVNILDANRLITTAAGTIETVTIKNAAGVTVDSGALKTLNLEGTITSVTATSTGSKATVDTLALNLSGVDMSGVAAIDTDVKTLNVNSSKTASTIGTTTTSATTINVSGDAALTLSTLTLGAAAGNEVITVTNTAGVTITTALANDVTFTGGTGADSISIANTAKTIDLGAGDDTATISTTAFSAGGSLNGGAGNDTLVVTTVADSNIAGLPHIVGFETLKLDGVATGGKHNAYTFKALEIGTIAIAAAATATEFENVAAGVGLTVLADNAGDTTTVTLANATGEADVFDLTLKSDGDLDAGTVVLAGVETININSVDTDIDTSIPTTVNDNDLILTATAAKSIVVTGNTNLDLVNTSATLVTSFDASNATGNIEYTSANATIGEIVTIKGGAGDDILEGNSAITVNDIIFGGAGDDIITYTGGKDTFTGGAGNDTFKFGAGALGTKDVHLTIADLTKGDKIDLTGIATIAAAGAALLKWFQFESNTYLVVDNTAGAAFAATDSVIKITGLVDLTNSTYATDEIITIA